LRKTQRTLTTEAEIKPGWEASGPVFAHHHAHKIPDFPAIRQKRQRSERDDMSPDTLWTLAFIAVIISYGLCKIGNGLVDGMADSEF
jgi:hypothetical protein